jgi:hypothetical protein
LPVANEENDEKADEGIRLEGKVSKDGVSAKIVLSPKAPGILAHLFPGHTAKAKIANAIADRLVRKIEADEPMDEADAAFARHYLKGEAAKWIRCEEIQARAIRAAEEGRQLPAHAESSTESAKSTTDEWVAHFWEDASLVSDELLQELYARILSNEAHKAGSCSLRTLQVLRTLDRKTAEAFALVLPYAFGRSWIPTDEDDQLRVPHRRLADLDEAGLVNVHGDLITLAETSFFRWDNRVIRVRQGEGRQIHRVPLTRAGRELARVVLVNYSDRDIFKALLAVITAAVNRPVLGVPPHILTEPTPIVDWAEVPTEHWSGEVDNNNWRSAGP